MGRLVGLAALLVACVEDTGDEPIDARMPWPVEPFPLTLEPSDNPTTPEKVALGRMLFFDPILSSDGTVACFTCHSPIWGMGDGLPVSVGIGGVGPVGTGRTGPNMTRRNSQTLWNAAFREPLFWDGRAVSLEDQARFPLEAPNELNRPIDEVADDLRAIPVYRAMFQEAFADRDDPVSAETLAMALAAFERTLVSDDAPYDQYAAGVDAAMSAPEVEGMFLFGALGCAGCHEPPLFESAQFEITLLPTEEDPGRVEVTEDESDRDRFRVPTLRNARETPPFFHDGSVATLDEAVAIEVDGRASRAVTDAELAALIKFIEVSLMDKTRAPRIPLTVPSGLEVPLDGYKIPR